MNLVAQYRCECGEGPLYDPSRDTVFWTDIPTGRMFRLDCGTLAHSQIYGGLGGEQGVGGFTLQSNGDLLLFRNTDIALLVPETGEVRVVMAFVDEGSTRFNDTSAGPNGFCYAGTMGRTNESGGLFLLAPDRTLRSLFRGTGCANGMGWTPDLKTMYWTCSTRNLIFAYDYDAATGAMTRERLFHQPKDRSAEGTCDGLAVDSEGNVYSARWGGRAIYVFRPDGTLREKLPAPVGNVTSMCFGGADLKTLYITSAISGDKSTEAGGLFSLKVPIAGQAEFRSRIVV